MPSLKHGGYCNVGWAASCDVGRPNSQLMWDSFRRDVGWATGGYSAPIHVPRSGERTSTATLKKHDELRWGNGSSYNILLMLPWRGDS
jgi:hypothetical protein